MFYSQKIMSLFLPSWHDVVMGNSKAVKIFITLKLTSHSILHYLWSGDLSKNFSQLIYQYLSFLNIFSQ